MNKKNEKKNLKEMLYHAYKCVLYNEMVIERSDTWLSAKEGNENMVREIRGMNNEQCLKIVTRNL